MISRNEVEKGDCIAWAAYHASCCDVASTSSCTALTQLLPLMHHFSHWCFWCTTFCISQVSAVEVAWNSWWGKTCGYDGWTTHRNGYVEYLQRFPWRFWIDGCTHSSGVHLYVHLCLYPLQPCAFWPALECGDLCGDHAEKEAGIFGGCSGPLGSHQDIPIS